MKSISVLASLSDPAESSCTQFQNHALIKKTTLLIPIDGTRPDGEILQVYRHIYENMDPQEHPYAWSLGVPEVLMKESTVLGEKMKQYRMLYFSHFNYIRRLLWRQGRPE